MTIESEAYARHLNLKLAANDLKIPWQNLYVKLKNQGINVVGDKMKYGTDRDKLGALAEQYFKDIVPCATDMNKISFQSKYDFDVNGYKVDVKSSKPRQLNKRFSALSWSFSFKKQSMICDFFVCFCLSDQKSIEKILLVPSEFFKGLQTISVSVEGFSKWSDYSIKQDELEQFFKSLPKKQ